MMVRQVESPSTTKTLTSLGNELELWIGSTEMLFSRFMLVTL